LSLVTKEYHLMHPKWFLRLWYIWWKSCTYLALKLTLSPNGPKQACIWASSPRSTVRCIQNNFWAYGRFWRKRCTYHAPKLTLSPKGSKRYSTWPTTPRSSIGCIQNSSEAMVRLVQIVDLSCMETNTIDKWIEMRFYMTHVTRSSIGCVQNYFWNYGTFGANYGPIWHWY
jgi:hypothetical protein